MDILQLVDIILSCQYYHVYVPFTILVILIVLIQHFLSTLSQKTYYGARLTAIPTDIANDTEEVNIYFGRINTIKTNAFSQLSQCRSLSLSHNRISEIEPGAFNGLISLTSLSLQNNEISELEPGSFNGLSNVRSPVFLNSNRITTLRAGTFQGFVEVEDISMSNNKINSIQDNTFANLTKLIALSLAENNLESLSAGVFFGLESLNRLYLSGNHLTMLPADVFNHLPRPLQLGLFNRHDNRSTDNPLNCNPGLCWLKQEELQGIITWVNVYRLPQGNYPFLPRCSNEIDWDTWSCDHENDRGLSFTLLYLN